MVPKILYCGNVVVKTYPEIIYAATRSVGTVAEKGMYSIICMYDVINNIYYI